jgi:hypothetical protein
METEDAGGAVALSCSVNGDRGINDQVSHAESKEQCCQLGVQIIQNKFLQSIVTTLCV